MRVKIINSALDIIKAYKDGVIGRIEAHELLTELNNTVYNMFDFGLCDDINPGAIQDYIHRLQDKYTIEWV